VCTVQQKWTKPGVELESEYGVFVGFRVESDSVFVNFLELEWSRSLVSNFKVETKNDASVNCDFDVTNCFPKVEKFGVGV